MCFIQPGILYNVQFNSVQSLSHVRLFATPWTAAHRPFLSITNSRSLLKHMSIKSVMPSNHLLLFLSPSFPASESFPVSQFFTSCGQSLGVSASSSVLPMIYSAYKLNKQGDNMVLTYSFPNLEPVHCSTSGSNCCFLTCIQISQEAGKVVWSSHLLKNLPLCCDPHCQRL